MKPNTTEYVLLHRWIKNNYGKADHCSNPECTYLNPKRYEWAKITGKPYERDINNYIQLCKSCHTKMDIHEVSIEYRKKLSEAATKRWATIGKHKPK